MESLHWAALVYDTQCPAWFISLGGFTIDLQFVFVKVVVTSGFRFAAKLAMIVEDAVAVATPLSESMEETILNIAVELTLLWPILCLVSCMVQFV